jgi:hypothetical protein
MLFWGIIHPDNYSKNIDIVGIPIILIKDNDSKTIVFLMNPITDVMDHTEYSEPDCLLFARNHLGQNVFLIELKQWSRVEATDIEGNYVETF